MTLPVLVKTWQYSVNQALASQASALISNQKLIFSLKSTITGFGSSPWQVRGSSGTSGTTSCIALGAAGPATDNWVTFADLVWNPEGTTHSWIVLRQTGISSRFELLIALNSNQNNQISFIVSPTGFVGGSSIYRPTAIDETKIQDGGFWGGANVTNAYVTHIMMSSDGACTRWILYSAGVILGVFFIEAPQNPISGWTYPFMGYSNTGASTLIYSNMFNTTGKTSKSPADIIPTTTIAVGSNGATLPQATINVASTAGFPTSGFIHIGTIGAILGYSGSSTTTFTGTNGSNSLSFGTLVTGQVVTYIPPGFNFSFTGELYAINTLIGAGLQVPNDLSTLSPLSPIGMACITIPNRGRHGSVFDLWWTLSSYADGDTFPSGATKTFVVMGDVVFPWNGTTLVTT